MLLNPSPVAVMLASPMFQCVAQAHGAGFARVEVYEKSGTDASDTLSMGPRQ